MHSWTAGRAFVNYVANRALDLCTRTVFQIVLISYGTAHIQGYKITRVTSRSSRNFACNLCVGLVRHEEYTACEQLLMR